MKLALKSREEVFLSTLRLLLAAVQNKEIALKRGLTEGEICEVISSQIKMRRDALEHYRRGNRQDMVDREEKELEYLTGYLPSQLSEDEIRREITRAIAEVEARGPKDFGRVMKILMPRTQGRADNRTVSELTRYTLSSLEA